MLYRIVINSHQKQDNLINLESDQEHYLRRVVRLNNGDIFIALDGNGKGWQVKLTADGGEILDSLMENRELLTKVTLMIALPKGNGFEDIIRCVTELGVNSLQPVISDRTIVKPKENKLERWRKIAMEASEQCERLIVPNIEPPIPVKQAFSQFHDLNIPKYIAVARSNAPHLLHFLQQNLSPSEMVIATGCEGGWTPKEVQSSIEHGFQEISLGNRILRAVTAPIMAMSLVSSFDFN
ncbi:16S rRNA (uracil(1498)-N(3))-methyltransferase [Geminocystis sp. CENA526]|uniref:16S rRNA (uracil(1498)-N(3))-methyltransferase n=1 Tax=Geminocystis sp. CENA526 TaxID=1355871 RepID=UPI003D6E914D